MELDFPSLPYVFSNIIAVGVVIIAMIWSTIARIILSLIFIAAFFINTYAIFSDPQVYLGFSELTSNEFYRSVIVGPFNKHIQFYVGTLAIIQLLIGIFTLQKGKLMRVFMIVGALFLLAIAPLEIGSAFPSTLIMAMAYLILLRKKIHFNVYDLVRRKMHYSNK